MNVVSLFSGVGGLDLGFLKAGHNIIWANDNYDDAVATYKKNIGNHITLKNIEDVSIDEIPNHDILIGGFPCQGFSLANMKRSESDERNKLYLEFYRVLSQKQPKFFVAENVKGILSLSKGKVFEMILDDFSSAGYNVKYKVLNAANFGVPQKRERVIIIGTRKDIDEDIIHPHPTHSEKDFSKCTPWLSIGKALQDLPDPDKEHNLKNHTYSKFKLKFNGYIGNRAIDPNKPAPTVTARGDSKGGVVVLHHPNNLRRMSVRELACTQSFPLDFEFIGTNSSAYRQIGNAVPPKLAYAIGCQFPVTICKNEYKNTKETVCQL